jgi:hypothetical protein
VDRGSITTSAATLIPIAFAATAITAAATAAITPSTTFFTSLRFVDRERATRDIGAIDTCDRLGHRVSAVHGHKCESTWTAAVTIRWEMNIRYRSVWGEKGFEILFGRIERQIAYIHFHNIKIGSRIVTSLAAVPDRRG